VTLAIPRPSRADRLVEQAARRAARRSSAVRNAAGAALPKPEVWRCAAYVALAKKRHGCGIKGAAGHVCGPRVDGKVVLNFAHAEPEGRGLKTATRRRGSTMTVTATEETGLSQRQEMSAERAMTRDATEVLQQVQGAIIVAKRFPRSEDAAFAALMKACRRHTFAEDAAYSFKRGKRQDEKGQWVDNYVTGPSVYLAREAKRVWGNMQSGVEIVRDDEKSRKIRAWAWDVETNTRQTFEDEFLKLIQRKVGRGRDAETKWVVPDERDLRELTNRRAAIAERNCILATLPNDLIYDALKIAEDTIRKGITDDPDGARKKIILAFGEINVTPDMLIAHLGHPIVECSPNELAELRKVYKSIVDGNSSWADYTGAPATQNGSTDAPRPRRASDTVATPNQNATPSEEATAITGSEPASDPTLSTQQVRTESATADAEASGNAGPEATSAPPVKVEDLELCEGGKVINRKCDQCLATLDAAAIEKGNGKTCPKGHAMKGLFCETCMQPGPGRE
jgi:hypothetical protein